MEKPIIYYLAIFYSWVPLYDVKRTTVIFVEKMIIKEIFLTLVAKF